MLFTSTSTTPYSVATFSASFSMACSSETSTVSAQAAGEPISRDISAVRAALSASRSTATTRAPASAKANAVARPMPLPAPVTSTSCPPNRSAYRPVATVEGAGIPASRPSLAVTNSVIQALSWSGRVRGTQCLAGIVRRTSRGAHSSSPS